MRIYGTFHDFSTYEFVLLFNTIIKWFIKNSHFNYGLFCINDIYFVIRIEVLFIIHQNGYSDAKTNVSARSNFDPIETDLMVQIKFTIYRGRVRNRLINANNFPN